MKCYLFLLCIFYVFRFKIVEAAFKFAYKNVCTRHAQCPLCQIGRFAYAAFRAATNSPLRSFARTLCAVVPSARHKSYSDGKISSRWNFEHCGSFCRFRFVRRLLAYPLNVNVLSSEADQIHISRVIIIIITNYY